MARVSNAVNERVKELYAIMATMAAKKALFKIECNNAAEAEIWAGHVEKWLARAGAGHARHTYERPKR